MKIGVNGLNLIKSFEGLRLKPYPDSRGIATIGIGTILYPNGKAVTMQDPPITEQQAMEYLQYEVDQKTTGVANLVKVPINQNEADALICFAYNVGLGALQKSSLLRFLNNNDKIAASNEFGRWNKAGGQEIPGLTRRRQAEKDLFLKPVEATDSISTDYLPDGPSDEDINLTLEKIENEAKKV